MNKSLVEITIPALSWDKDKLSNIVSCIESKFDIVLSYAFDNLRYNDLLYGDDSITRALNVFSSLSNDKLFAVWAWGAGYGSYAIMEFLFNKIHLLRSRILHKLFIGFSDVTALHIMLNCYLGSSTVYWYNIKDLYRVISTGQLNHDSSLYFEAILKNRYTSLQYEIFPVNNLARYRKHNLQGKIIGGNLRIIISSLATFWQIDCADRIVFLEDVDESYFAIDRMLEHCLQSCILYNAKAIIFGSFTRTMYKGNNYINDVIIEFAKKVNIPVFSINNIGHDVVFYPLVFMKDIIINVDSNFLRYCE